ncbi:unnamed protein product, partial [Meganyctiphanes norvegica]
MAYNASDPLKPIPYALVPPSQYVATSRQDEIEYEVDVDKNIIPNAPVSGMQDQPEYHPPQEYDECEYEGDVEKNIIPRVPESVIQNLPENCPEDWSDIDKYISNVEKGPGLECSMLEKPGLKKSWLEFKEFFEDCEEDCCVNTCLAIFYILHPVTLAILSTIGMFIFLTPGSSEEMPGSR